MKQQVRWTCVLGMAAMFSLVCSTALHADAGISESDYEGAPAVESSVERTAPSPTESMTMPEPSSREVSRPLAAGAGNSAYPKVQTPDDELMAKKFEWWPTDAKPGPVKDPDRSGYWWWPEVPGEARPWGNQGFVYVRKIIFDYKSADTPMRPSLVIKKVIKNVKVFFDYDKSDLREDARDVLSKAMYTLEHNPKADILITGNADVRGSEQYNLKLGERRAAAVQDFMIAQGLPETRIRILSRGKLDAMAPTNDLVGMQKDRNAQFMIAEVEEVMIPADKAAYFGGDATSPSSDSKPMIVEKENLESAVKVATKDYVIQAGDSLWAIAKREYGDGMQWKRIYNFNKDVISNPDRPKKGTKIKIPIE